MQYRRAKIEGGTYFFTLVTYGRAKLFSYPENIDLLKRAFLEVMTRHPFTIDAFVVLPDHLHCIWTLPETDRDFSKRWRQIKSSFSRRCKSEFKPPITPSKLRKKEQAVWQRRFWEHVIRDERDFTRHVEYIHYNPVKHGLVQAPGDWKYPSFHRYVRRGVYDLRWGSNRQIEFDSTVGRE
ncbi:MAG: transposase [Desulfoferrobacter sp.]